MSMQKGKHQGGQNQGYRFSQQHGPDGYHVSNVGGGGGGQGGPQPIRLHHPPMPPPPQQQQPVPTPTSTPPADMQKPQHMHQQQPMPQGQMNYVQNQQRTQNNFYSATRTPPTRMPNHRPPMVQNNVQQIPFQLPMFGTNQVLSTPLQSGHPIMVAGGQYPGIQFQGQARHNGGGTFYAQPGPQQIIMAPQHGMTQCFNVSSGQQFYLSMQNPLMQRTGGGGGQGGAPPTQQGSALSLPGPMLPAPLQQGVQQQGGGGSGLAVGGGKQTRRRHALQVVDPVTGKDVIADMLCASMAANNNNVPLTSPPHSNDSSARETPQPNVTGPAALDIAADFAVRVALAATDKVLAVPQSPTLVSDINPTFNGPPASLTPPLLSDDTLNVTVPNEVTVPIVRSKVPVPTLDKPIIEFKPRSHMDIVIPVVLKEESSRPLGPTPVVSAITNSPDVEVHHRAPRDVPREPFPALKQNTTSGANVTVQQSPVRTNSKKNRSEEPVLKKATKMDEKRKEETAPVIAVPPKERDKKEASPPAEPVMPAALPEPPIMPVTAASQVTATAAPLAPTTIPTPIPVPAPVPIPQPPVHSSFADTLDLKNISTLVRPPPPPHVVAAPPLSSQAPPHTPADDKQTNGETVAEPADGKAAQRSKSKRGGKIRELNRKGVEKEGTDMDAFTEPSSEEITATPTVVSVNAVPPPPVPEVRKIVTPPPAVVQDIIIKNEVEDREEKLVAARNEENAKVSALIKPADDEEDQQPALIEPQPVLLTHNYKEDQWSPLNPEGKKKYERDFLMLLQNHPQSKKKPENLPDLEVVLNSSMNRVGQPRIMSSQQPYMNSIRGQHENLLLPVFVKASQSQRGLAMKRNSQQGKVKPGGGKPNVIHMTLSLREDVKLRETENAWKPARQKATPNLTEEEKSTEDLYKKVRGILNKLTPQKFETLVMQVKSLPIDNLTRLQGVMDLVFEKAVDEPGFSKAYANMCKTLALLQVLDDKQEDKQQPAVVNFRKLLITRCQVEFEKDTSAELDSTKKLAEINAEPDMEKKKDMQLLYEEHERRVRMKSVGNIRFIGELFKLNMLTPAIMIRCIQRLISFRDEESLECLCKLLTTIGKDLEYKPNISPPVMLNDLTGYFTKMRELSSKNSDSKVSSRVRFMLQDVIELRQNKWVPRRDDNNPKTMDQIQREAERESVETSLALSAPRSKQHDGGRQDNTPGDRKRQQNRNVQNEEGWQNVKGRNYTIETSKLQYGIKSGGEPVQQTVLGPSSGLCGDVSWRQGSTGTGSKRPTDNKASREPNTNKGFSDSNYYSALRSTEERKAPPPIINTRPGGKITPSPSIEKERALTGLKEAMDIGRHSRGSSLQRGGPEPANSLEGSALRQAVAPPPLTPRLNSVPRLAPEQVVRETKTIIEEFLSNNNIEESKLGVAEVFGVTNSGLFVEQAFNLLLEKSATAWRGVALLFSQLIESNLVATQDLSKELKNVIDLGQDIAIDVPHIWKYLAELIVPTVISGVFTFTDIRTAAEGLLNTPRITNLLLPILQLLIQEKGRGWVQSRWASSGCQLSDFLPPDNVDAFVKENDLEFLNRSAACELTLDDIRQKLSQLLSADESYDKICDWINSLNIENRGLKPQFVRALMIAVCDVAISNGKELNDAVFRKHYKLIQRFVDTKEELEVQCLYGIQSVIHRLEYPSGLLLKLFEALWEDTVISSEAFIKWRDGSEEEGSAEKEGKGVAVKSLTQFYVILNEGLSESDEAS